MTRKKNKIKVKNGIADLSKLPQEERRSVIANGLTEAIMGFNFGGIGTQLNQVDTLFINNRWYLISNMRQPLSEVYAEHGIVRTIIDVPVNDALRGGVDIKTKQLSPEEVEELQAEIKIEKDLIHLGQALKWNRLFGGAGLIAITDQDPASELDIDAIDENTPLEFRAVDMWELFWDKQNVESTNLEVDTQDFEHYNYYGKKLHKSRVMTMRGITAPSFIRPRLRGWGLSQLESIITSINQYFKSNNLVFEVLDEFKLDIFKLKNLASTLLSANGTAIVRQRVDLTNKQKNYMNAITLDADDGYEQKQLSFAGIAEMYKEFRMQMACDTRMPISKIFGVASSGFSSGEDDIENYNAMIESEIRSIAEPDVLKIVKLRCQKMFGHVPDDLSIVFRPLRMLSAEQEETVKTAQFARVIQALQAGAMDGKDFKDACNKANLLPIQLDPTKELLVMDQGNEDASGDGIGGRESSTKAKDAKEAKDAPKAKD